ncbi:MAG: hypothetical protein U0X93_09975 [Anaerolineales bacterium]
MLLLGFVLPPQVGLILLAIKPQVGIGLGLYWFITIWKYKGLKEVAMAFAPVTILLLVSFVIYNHGFCVFGTLPGVLIIQFFSLWTFHWRSSF